MVRVHRAGPNNDGRKSCDGYVMFYRTYQGIWHTQWGMERKL